eukprot:TRINITY_DN16526_c0_g1_i1.p2 TRINITY_DN16526_c0_g1~~TRINITY_DN16526_c0_g1_i1.p2  ORF type:complete len:118 (-),score=15.85 TRINITY_DN16526_c0_g1_i1:179-532(-)
MSRPFWVVVQSPARQHRHHLLGYVKNFTTTHALMRGIGNGASLLELAVEENHVKMNAHITGRKAAWKRICHICADSMVRPQMQPALQEELSDDECFIPSEPTPAAPLGCRAQALTLL